MPLPRPELGLVVHYGFVWNSANRPNPPDAGKDRPCLIVDLFEVNDPLGRRQSVRRPVRRTTGYVVFVTSRTCHAISAAK